MAFSVEDFISENRRRNELIFSEHDPISGVGCDTVPRKLLELEDFTYPRLYLPIEMWENEPIVRNLEKYGGIFKLIEASGGKKTQENYFGIIEEFMEIRSRYDFEFYAIYKLCIRDKISGMPSVFILNRGQRKLIREFESMRLNGMPIRVILLKARQWGGSTATQMYFFWIMTTLTKGFNSVICAHVQDAARNILNMFKLAGENYPLVGGNKNFKMIPKMGMQNAKEIVGRDCSITVGSAERPDSVRSQSVHLAHFSEVGVYPTTPSNNPKSLIASITSIIPNVPLTAIVYESTAKGVGNYFHKEWLQAKNGETRNVPVFVAWFEIDLYREPIKEPIESFIQSLSDYELELWDLGATLEAINWYRIKSKELNDTDAMKQEFPSTPEEAFRSAGDIAFSRRQTEKLRKRCFPPIMVGELFSKRVTISECKLYPNLKINLFDDLFFEKKERGNFKIWSPPAEERNVSERYVVVVDPGGRTSTSDPSCICVIDRYNMVYGEPPEVVAEWHGHTDLDLLAWNAVQIAHWYHKALLVFESNTYESKEEMYNRDGNSSEFIFSEIAGYYNNLYSRTPADKIAAGEPPVYGFHTNRTTKPMIVHDFQAILRELDGGGGYIERCSECVDEYQIYEKREDGTYGNVKGEGNHDDRVMTRLIGLHVCYKMPFPRILDTKKVQSVRTASLAVL